MQIRDIVKTNTATLTTQATSLYQHTHVYTYVKAQTPLAVLTHTPYLLHLNTVRALEGRQSTGHHAREEGVDGALTRVLQLIEGGVHEEPAEEVGPGDIVHGVLFGGDGTRHYLSIDMVRQDCQ